MTKRLKDFQKNTSLLKSEIASLIIQLEKNPTTGIHLGNNIYKIRMAVASKGKGRRGGARVMSYVKVLKETVYLFSIYSKGEKDNISDEEIKDLIRNVV